MLGTLGRALYRRRHAVLAAALAVLAAASIWGAGVFGDLAGSGFGDPGSESGQAGQILDERLPRDSADVVAVYTSRDRTAADPEYRRAVDGAVAELPRATFRDVATPWSTRSARLVSADRRSVAVVFTLAGTDDSARGKAYERIREQLSVPPAGYRVEVGGRIAVSNDINKRVESDIRRAELLSLPALLLLLLVLIGGVVAAVLPVITGALVITGAFAILRALALVTDVSVFSVNVVSMLGLGLAVDYALLVVTRFREELREQPAVEEAVARTVASAGRAVLTSGLIVASALACLFLFPQVYFRSMAIAGIAVTALAVLAALTALPALLAVLGHRVDALRVPLRRRARRGRHRPKSPGTWFRFAAAVMRRPVAVVPVVVPLLALLGAPFLRVNFGDIDYRVLPDGTQSREVAERLAADFPGGGKEPIDAIVTFPAGTPRATTDVALGEYAERLRALPGVTSVSVTARAGVTARVSVSHTYDRQSAQARSLVEDVRVTTAPPGGRVLVGGNAAELTDLLASLRNTLPWMALAMVCVTLLVLFIAFGSVLLPVKAVVMSVLSLSASFGAVVWVFQDGNLSGLLDFTPTGAIEATQPILMFAVAFGLSTDYEVFLLSRVREEWDRTGDNTLAVATGVQRTAPIITSAALLLIVVIGAFSLSGISFLKMIGLGLALTILVDATVIRALLVPATMRLMGRATWWAPARLTRSQFLDDPPRSSDVFRPDRPRPALTRAAHPGAPGRQSPAA